MGANNFLKENDREMKHSGLPGAIQAMVGTKKYSLDRVGMSDSEVRIYDDCVLKIRPQSEETPSRSCHCSVDRQSDSDSDPLVRLCREWRVLHADDENRWKNALFHGVSGTTANTDYACSPGLTAAMEN